MLAETLCLGKRNRLGQNKMFLETNKAKAYSLDLLSVYVCVHVCACVCLCVVHVYVHL